MTHPIDRPRQDPELSFSTIICGTAMLGCAGAVAAAVFTPIAPVGGAIFGASYFLSNRLIYFICQSVNCCPDSLIAKVATFALSTLGGVVAAMAITAAFGIHMTFTAGVVLAIATIGTAIAAILTLGGCLCCSAIVTGVALGNNDGFTIRV